MIPCLNAHTEGIQLMMEMLGGFGQNHTGIQARVPDTAKAQRNLFDQVMYRVSLCVQGLIWVKVEALLRDGQDTKTGTSQSRDSHQVMGPDSVTYRQK